MMFWRGLLFSLPSNAIRIAKLFHIQKWIIFALYNTSNISYCFVCTIRVINWRMPLWHIWQPSQPEMQPVDHNYPLTWWRHQMEIFSAFLTLCAGESPVPVNFPHNGQWRGALMFSLTCALINGWVNNGEAGDLRRHRAHYGVTVMETICPPQRWVSFAMHNLWFTTEDRLTLIANYENKPSSHIPHRNIKKWYSYHLTHYSPITPYGSGANLVHVMACFVSAPSHSLANIDLSSKVFCGFRPKAVSHNVLKNLSRDT